MTVIRQMWKVTLVDTNISSPFEIENEAQRNAQQGEPEHRELRAKDDHMMQDSPAALHRTRAWHGGWDGGVFLFMSES